MRLVGRYMVRTMPSICLPICTTTSIAPAFVLNMVDLEIQVRSVDDQLKIFLILEFWALRAL